MQDNHIIKARFLVFSQCLLYYYPQWSNSVLYTWSPSADSPQELSYVDLQLNPERYTGYAGHSTQRIWGAIYHENCFRCERHAKNCLEWLLYFDYTSPFCSSVPLGPTRTIPLLPSLTPHGYKVRANLLSCDQHVILLSYSHPLLCRDVFGKEGFLSTHLWDAC